MSASSVIVIPARLASTRLPRKLLLPLAGQPVLWHTWQRAQQVAPEVPVIIATDSEEVANLVRSWGGDVRMTPASCQSGTERICALLDELEADFFLNVQGDEPFIDPDLLRSLLQRARDTGCDLVTAVTPIRSRADLFNPSVVKAVRASDGRAVYFTRATAPYLRDVSWADWIDQRTHFRHLGVYGYTRAALQWYAQQAPCALEQQEKLEQLRFVDHQWNFQTVVTDYAGVGIDTPEDLRHASRLMEQGLSPEQLMQPPSVHEQVAQTTLLHEIEALQSLLPRNRQEITRAVELILTAKGKVVVTGLGKSGLVGHKIAATLASTGTPAVFLNAAEALHGDLGLVNPGDVVLMLSNSAATVELIKMLPSLKKIGVDLIGIFGQLQTQLAQEMRVVIDISAVREACPLGVAPMSTTTNTLAVGDALAAALMKAKGFTDEDFAVYHPGGSLGRKLLLHVRDVMHPAEALPQLTPEATLDEVLVAMTQKNLGAVCLTEEGRLAGIITEGDIRRALVRYRDLNLKASQVMTPRPIAIGPDERLGTALERMEAKQIYVLPVVDASQRYLGLLRMHDTL
ncbi:MAG: 3-deoxy-manno-octulosonate cytidylyltransferase [Verrucomicrobiota bacterium JB022]|nr:3-deoxy-manno-octulosonate cytidylyltransferase [Verrucomicrobiota bacterium JB022]